MRLYTILLLFGFLLLSGCHHIDKENHFSHSEDTLRIKTTREKGLGTIGYYFVGSGKLYFSDNTDEYFPDHKFPEDIQNIEIAYLFADIKPFFFDWQKTEGPFYQDKFLEYLKLNKLDTTNLPSFLDNTISIMKGVYNNERIYIVDQNNNQDFRDDSIRFFKPFDWKSTEDLILCNFKIYDERILKTDSAWIKIGIKGNDIWTLGSNHIVSTFYIDNQNFQIEIFDSHSMFTFDDPNLALLTENGHEIDSVIHSEILKLGEYIRLNGVYYKFAAITNDGSYITLIKERDFQSQAGTQVGMIAPGFTSKTISGDTISLQDYKGQYILLANLTACWSPISSYQHYRDMTDEYKDRLSFIGIDNSTESLPQNVESLNLPGHFIFAEIEKNEVQKNYRQEFSSRTCFLIGPDGRIIDRFEIDYWSENLKNHFANLP